MCQNVGIQMGVALFKVIFLKGWACTSLVLLCQSLLRTLVLVEST